MKWIENLNIDPCYNMAFDEYMLEHVPSDVRIFYLWRNRPSVIIGVNQNARNEVRVDEAINRGVSIVRRSTGGGAVYHDLGNINYSFIGNPSDKDYLIKYILSALNRMGIKAEKTGRNDLLADGQKISGMAELQRGGRMLLHGTLMYDVDIEQMTALLTPDEKKLQSNGIKSVRSRVRNIKPLWNNRDIDSFIKDLHRMLADGDEAYNMMIDTEEIKRIADSLYRDDNWTYKM